MQNKFMKAMDFRHACKAFDETKKIPDETMRYILEAGHKSPSSFGQEGWKFLVITNEALKAKLRPVCWNQVQITSCSHLVVILTAIEDLRPSSGTPAKRFGRRPLSPEQIQGYIDLYGGFLADTLSSDEKTCAWGARQCYIALANMMTAAAYEEIDSCPIEGFEKAKVEEILGLDTSKYQVAVLVPFGYRINPQSEQIRLPFEEVVEFID
ncbi:NAD(P)H-dependent oxidoreductase [Sulfurovum sp. zt1-1]|uniref:NAD(P)H-dependent oxidoreductase n=1 Tax=Sulfurovum zhangzhouensis TaxID=3019067 RepID=A0ABT7QYI0_9BACT|nr:NAD(P)H-dependent oxidoreductase [Sulfurovum zhangzhouensis]MDM5271893.1 NAD(P)H-dependent oxidoreductase [Sulfurovum zhangzhouensis]